MSDRFSISRSGRDMSQETGHRPLRQPSTRTAGPRTVVTIEQAERVLNSVLDDTDGGTDLMFDILARLAEAAAPAGLDVDVLRQCPSLMAILNRLGKFNEAWWDRLAAEYARLRQGTEGS